eukprot:RCo022886
MASQGVQAALLEISNAIRSKEFKSLSEGYIAEHCTKFELEEENKLEYTALHKRYIEIIEKFLSERLAAKKMAMETVEAGLEEYLKAQAAPGAQVDDNIAEAISFLTTLSEFQTFKDLMLARKLELHKAAPLGSSVLVTDAGKTKVRELLGTARKLLDANVRSDAAWTVIVDKPELKVEQCATSKVLRGCIVVDLPQEDCIQMFIDHSPESKGWRPDVKHMESIRVVTCTGTLPGGIPEDHIVRIGVNMPQLLRWLASVPDEFVVRCVVDYDAAEKVYSWIIVGWDLATDSEATGSFRITKSGTVRAGDNGRSLASFTEDMVSWLPGWVYGAILRTQTSNRMSRMVAQYRQVRQKTQTR